MKRFFKRLGLLVLLILVLVIIFNFQLLKYGIEQATGQLKIIYNARPIEEVLSDQSIPDTIKYKLRLIEEIKTFAEDSLGINKSKNYQTYYDQKGKPAIYVISGCEPFELKEYEWNFPIIGSFTYKGFFNVDRAKKEEATLKAEGYDTDLGTASGWSTLGWFKDPVLSGMLRRKEGSLANLIIHELTHGTLYIKDSVEYNENLANFIGDKGAIRFLKSKFGNNSDQLTEYEYNKQDREKYINHILQGANSLTQLYQQLESESDTKTKIIRKKERIKDIILSLDTIDFHNKKAYTDIVHPDSINNTFFVDFMKYNSKQDSFEEEFNSRFGGNLKEFLKYLKNKYPSL